MFQLLKNANYDFLGRGKLFLGVSSALVLASIGIVLVRGINLGIEFTGGTELQVRYAQPPDVAAIRSSLERAGIPDAIVTTIGDPAEHDVYIRLASESTEPAASAGALDSDVTARVMQALQGPAAEPGRVDLNSADRPTIESVLRQSPQLAGDEAKQLADVIAEARRERAIFRSIDDLATLPGMTPAALEILRQHADVGPLSLRSQSYIGPAIGRELLRKAMFAILGSLLGMLVYIGFRFQFQWGAAAVLALTHDTLITLGLFSLLDKELSLSVIAAFLTLVGYSVNDTVVIFDRVRENLRSGSRLRLTTLINDSVNQTLSRTLITSGLTWIAVLALYLFGGQALNAFAFVLVVGVIVGSYSTIYIASPILVLWQDMLDRRRARPPSSGSSATTSSSTRTASAPAEGRPRKVRTTSTS